MRCATVAKGATSISEEEIVSAVSKIAVERYPELSEAQAFSRIFTASTEEARVLNSAINVAKTMPFVFDDTPLQVGGEDTRADDPAKAIAQLRQIARSRWPNESEAAGFERALTDPANSVLARKAVPIPRATTSFQFPR
jgi:hypothetical protein